MPKTYEIECFYPGEHRLSSGDRWVFTISQLQRSVDLYNRRVAGGGNYAPVVLGHPEDNAPQFGFVKRAFIEDNALWLEVVVNDNLNGWLEEGYYPERSISFYDEIDPKTGEKYLYLDHIGFLGAVPPALANLRNDGLPIPEEWIKQPSKKPAMAFSLPTEYKFINATDGKRTPSKNKRSFAMEEQEARELFTEMFNENITPITETLNQIRTDIQGIQEQLSGGEEEPEEEVEAEEAAKPDPAFSAFAKKINDGQTQMSAEIMAIRNETSAHKFSAWLDSENVRSRMTKETREKAIKMFSSLATKGKAFSVGANGTTEDSEEITSFKEMIESLPAIAPTGADVYTNGKAFSSFHPATRGNGVSVEEQAKRIEKMLR